MSSSLERMTFDHVGLSVADMARSHAFYRDVLGFTTVEDEFEMPAHELRGLVLVNGAGVRIELFQRGGSQPRPPADMHDGALLQGWFQFALLVDDIEATYARVVAAGATPLMAPRTAPDGVSKVAFTGDPDGNLVEFLQRA